MYFCCVYFCLFLVVLFLFFVFECIVPVLTYIINVCSIWCVHSWPDICDLNFKAHYLLHLENCENVHIDWKTLVTNIYNITWEGKNYFTCRWHHFMHIILRFVLLQWAIKRTQNKACRFIKQKCNAVFYMCQKFYFFVVVVFSSP